MSAGRDGTLVPLVDRVRWIAMLRVLLVVTGAVLWGSSDRDLSSGGSLAVVTIAYLCSTGLFAVVRAGRSATRAGLDVGLLLDSVALVLAVQAFGGVQTPAAALFALHAAGATLLTSFRTGVKVAGAHTVVVLCLVQAQATGVVAAGPHAGVFPSNFTGFVALLWATTLGTATFAAVNERELRRRRHDAEVLHRLLVHLTEVDDCADVVSSLSDFVRAELPAPWATVLLVGDRPEGEAEGVDEVLRRAEVERRPVLVRTPDPARDRWLHASRPQARGVLVVPLPQVAGRGWLVVDLGGDRKGLQRRALHTLEQAVSHTAMALSRARAVEALRQAATLDGLTGVANRRTLDEALHRATADGGRDLSVALLDVDHFKSVNDTYGHQTGDEVLRAVATAAASAVRAGDLVARYGGEEFAVLMPQTGTAEAQVLVERLRAAVAASTAPGVTCSAGIAGGPGNPAELLAAADEALYAAKAAGRDRSVVRPAAGPVVTGEPTGSGGVDDRLGSPRT